MYGDTISHCHQALTPQVQWDNRDNAQSTNGMFRCDCDSIQHVKGQSPPNKLIPSNRIVIELRVSQPFAFYYPICSHSHRPRRKYFFVRHKIHTYFPSNPNLLVLYSSFSMLRYHLNWLDFIEKKKNSQCEGEYACIVHILNCKPITCCAW